MSIHEIEALAECSVRVLAATQPIPADARELCRGLYDLQDQFDGGYTVLRVPEELERLGYLRRLSPEQLPEPERSEAFALSKEGGFFGESPKTYFDRASGFACVTAGSPLWKKLCREGLLTGTVAAPMGELTVLELAERIAELASTQGGENAAETMGLWYALFPAFMMMNGEDEDEEPPLRMLALRDQLATPEALAAAAEWGRLPEPEDFGGCDAFEAQWMEPYIVWASAQREGKKTHNALDDQLALALKSLGYYQQLLAEGKELSPAEGLLSPEEVREVYQSVAERLTPGDTAYSYAKLALAACHAMLGNHEDVFGSLWDAYAPAVEKIASEPDLWKRRFTTAMLGAIFYRALAENIPDGVPEKRALLARRVDGLPTITEAREIFASLLNERPDETWNCHFQIGLCLLDEMDLGRARRELQEADRLHPGDPDIQIALELADKLQKQNH